MYGMESWQQWLTTTSYLAVWTEILFVRQAERDGNLAQGSDLTHTIIRGFLSFPNSQSQDLGRILGNLAYRREYQYQEYFCG